MSNYKPDPDVCRLTWNEFKLKVESQGVTGNTTILGIYWSGSCLPEVIIYRSGSAHVGSGKFVAEQENNEQDD